jgi:hypothetical protein
MSRYKIRKKIGVVGVDSGQLIITDPAYIFDEDNAWKDIGVVTYDDFIKKTRAKTKQLKFKKGGRPGLGLNISDFGGDGLFVVEGRKHDKYDFWEEIVIKINRN